MKATCLTCDRRRKSACWRSSWQVSPNIFRSNFGEDIADLCIDCVDVQWLLALVGGGNPSDSPRRSSWTSPRTWMAPWQGWSSQNLTSSNKFSLSIRGFWELSPIWATSSPSRWPLRCGILTRLFLSTRKNSFPNFLSPRTRRIRRVFRVILCSRIGGISIVQKQKRSDVHSNEPNKILWLNWFVEAPFLRCFSNAKVPSSIQLAAIQQYHLILNVRFSSFPPIWTVDWSTATAMQRTS